MLLQAGKLSTAFKYVSSGFQANVLALPLGGTKADLSLS